MQPMKMHPSVSVLPSVDDDPDVPVGVVPVDVVGPDVDVLGIEVVEVVEVVVVVVAEAPVSEPTGTRQPETRRPIQRSGRGAFTVVVTLPSVHPRRLSRIRPNMGSQGLPWAPRGPNTLTALDPKGVRPRDSSTSQLCSTGTNPAPSARTHLGLEKLRFWIFGGFFGGLKVEFSVALDSLRAVHAKAPSAPRSTASAFILGESVDLRGPRTKLPKHAHGDEPVRDPYSSCPGESAPTFQGRRSVGGYGKGRVVASADA